MGYGFQEGLGETRAIAIGGGQCFGRYKSLGGFLFKLG
jgi:hypothetical protein